MGRSVTLALVNRAGTALGTLPAFEVALPWWQTVWDVVAGARAAFGIAVVVLRLLTTEPSRWPGGAVSYLAEYDGPPPAQLIPPPGHTDWTEPAPHRMAWAHPGGPAQSLAWARTVLGKHDIAETGPPVQHRAWNLSTIWRLDTTLGPVWLKQVPGFAAHEATVLRLLGERFPGLVPELLGEQGGRSLMRDVPGRDGYDATQGDVREMLDDLLTVQAVMTGQTAELLDRGVPDRRAEALLPLIRETVDDLLPELTPGERDTVTRLVDGLPARLADVSACGVPDTLVHGDFHPGNVRLDGGNRVILDWGDSVVGHPALDLKALLERVDARHHPALREQWCARWRAAVPGCAPERAFDLMRPVNLLRAAVVYREFLAAIEPSEQPFHAADPLNYLREVARLPR